MTEKHDKLMSFPTFDEVVDRLQAAGQDAQEYGPAASLLSGNAAQPQDEPAYVSPNRLSEIYGSTLETVSAPPGPSAAPAAAAPPPVEPAREPEAPAPPTRPEDVAGELKVRRWHTVAQLIALRRTFAMKNHPDRVPGNAREAATIRMGIANTLIDDAIKARLPKP